MEKLNKKILVVDDEAALRKALAVKLNSSGFEAIEAGDGQEGIEKALTEHPDLILLDIMMPKMDGKGVMARLHADSWGKGVPVIFLTNLNDPVTVAEVSEASGANATMFDYLVKSDWKLEEVIEKIKKRLNIA